MPTNLTVGFKLLATTVDGEGEAVLPSNIIITEDGIEMETETGDVLVTEA
jgi:hypothetical protein